MTDWPHLPYPVFIGIDIGRKSVILPMFLTWETISKILHLK